MAREPARSPKEQLGSQISYQALWTDLSQFTFPLLRICATSVRLSGGGPAMRNPIGAALIVVLWFISVAAPATAGPLEDEEAAFKDYFEAAGRYRKAQERRRQKPV
jgi:hypothetical protein